MNKKEMVKIIDELVDVDPNEDEIKIIMNILEDIRVTRKVSQFGCNCKQNCADQLISWTDGKTIHIEEGIFNLLCYNSPNMDKEVVRKVAGIYDAMQYFENKGLVSDYKSMIRGFIAACDLAKKGVPMKDALISSIAHRTNDQEESNFIENFIRHSL